MSMDRKRIDQFVGMLGSDFDGERANAAGFLHKIAVEQQMSMVEFFSAVYGDGKVVYRDRVIERTVYRDRPAPTEPVKPKTKAKAKQKPDAAQRSAHQAASKAYGHKSMADKIDTVLKMHAGKLTEFETDFINSVRPKVIEGLDLTPRQRKVLSQIFKKVGL